MKQTVIILVVVVSTMTINMIGADKIEATERFFGKGGGMGGKGLDGLGGLPIGSYPLWKFHKYDGLSLKPVPIGLEIGSGIPAPPPSYMSPMQVPYDNGNPALNIPNLPSYGPPSYPPQQPQSYGNSYGNSYGGGYGQQPQQYAPQQYSPQPYAPQPQYAPQQPSYPGKCKTVCNDDYASNSYNSYSSPNYEVPAPYNPAYAPAPAYSVPPSVSYGPSSGGASYGSAQLAAPAYEQQYAPAPSYGGSGYGQQQQPQQYEPQPAPYAPAAPQYNEQPPPPSAQYPSAQYLPGQQPIYEAPPQPAPSSPYDGYKKRRSSSVPMEKNMNLKEGKERVDITKSSSSGMDVQKSSHR